MSFSRLVFASLWFHWRTNLAVACGVAVGAAVLTGALLVGDSMRGSLRHLTLDRLGRIDEAIVTDHFVRAALADELAGDSDIASPAILLRVSLERAAGSPAARANQVELIGCDARFWQLGPGGPQRLPQSRQIVLNRPLAEQLGVRVGDAVLLRLPRIEAIPADSALGKKRETIRSQRLTVSEIISAEGLGRFGLRSSQRLPRNAYVPLEWLQEQLEQPDRTNAIFIANYDDIKEEDNSRGRTARGKLSSKLQSILQPTDYGLNVKPTDRGYCNITSDRMVFDPLAEQAVLKAFRADAGVPKDRSTLPDKTMEPALTIQPSLTYLANTLACNGREIPYSTITALDFIDQPPLGPFLSMEERALPALGPDEIALNWWAADDLRAKPGDTVRLSYFEPESIDGQVREKTVALRLAAIVKLSGAGADRDLTPTVQGITDELTMAEWDPPFPFDAKRIRPTDETYWNDHGPTPKAFVSLATGRRLWSSRFGQTTSIRVAGPTHADVRDLLLEQLDPTAMGLVLQPIKRQALAASAGTTPFGVLFLCFSFFIIAAAVMLVALLFRLGIEQRAGQIGTLLALGLSRRLVGRLLLGEATVVAMVGSLLGVPVGIAYAALLLLGLRTWWLAAVGTPFLRLHITATSVAIGSFSGLAIALIVIWFSVRHMAKRPPRQLLAGQLTENVLLTRSANRTTQVALVVVAVGPTMALLLGHFSDEARAGAFFGSGALALLALLALVKIRLGAGMTGPAVTTGGGNLIRMALRNAARHPGRSTLTIGLVAAATFLIVAISAFRVDPNRQSPSLDSGNGGFALVAESDQPIFADLDSPVARKGLSFSTEDKKLLADSAILSFRVRAGDDASCLNVYRSGQPRVLGVPAALIARGGFAWAAKPPDTVNPWRLLDEKSQQEPQSPLAASQRATNAPAEPCIPVILEKNTANYALNLWGGLGETFDISDGHGRPLRLQVVALLSGSIFQGDLLIGSQAFLKHFPNTSGYRFFLIESKTEVTSAIRATLERELGDYGLAVETTGGRLADFLAIQNTYLSAFQSLGGLGLLLGTLGLAAVQVRVVFERRGELALLRATGFCRRRLGGLILLEHTVLLGAGLGIGVAAALLAVLPQVVARGSPLPWASLLGTLALVFVLGLFAGGMAVRVVLRAPLMLALCEERG